MKDSKTMLVAIATFLLTWLFIASIGWVLSDTISFKAVLQHHAVLMIMLMFGWLPSAIVAHDYWERGN